MNSLPLLHPCLAGLLLVTIAMASAPGHRVTVKKEVGFLRQKLGAIFDASCAKASRLFPGFRNYMEPEAWAVSPDRFWRALRDVVWFTWLAASVELTLSFKQDAGSPSLLLLFF